MRVIPKTEEDWVEDLVPRTEKNGSDVLMLASAIGGFGLAALVHPFVGIAIVASAFCYGWQQESRGGMDEEYARKTLNIAFLIKDKFELARFRRSFSDQELFTQLEDARMQGCKFSPFMEKFYKALKVAESKKLSLSPPADHAERVAPSWTLADPPLPPVPPDDVIPPDDTIDPDDVIPPDDTTTSDDDSFSDDTLASDDEREEEASITASPSSFDSLFDSDDSDSREGAVADSKKFEVISQNVVSLKELFKQKGITAEYRESIVAPSVERVYFNASAVDTEKMLKLNPKLLQVFTKASVPPVCSVDSNGIFFEIPNTDRTYCSFEDFYRPVSFEDKNITLPVGVDINSSLVEMTPEDHNTCHLLIAGMTGSGKSEWYRSAILWAIKRYSPQDLRITLIDPKRTEFSLFKGCPHLLSDIIEDPADVVEFFEQLVDEQESRYKALSLASCKSLSEFNAKHPENKKPRIFVFCDEFGDLMLNPSINEDLKILLQNLLQKARAAGIHLFLGLQRPSKDNMPGDLKCNLSARLCLRVGSSIESRIVLDEVGGEYLLGKGDCYYASIGSKQRLQSLYASSAVIEEEMRKYPVESQPVESQPVESQPVESQPVEPQPVESQPVEPQPVEPQPVETTCHQAVEPVDGICLPSGYSTLLPSWVPVDVSKGIPSNREKELGKLIASLNWSQNQLVGHTSPPFGLPSVFLAPNKSTKAWKVATDFIKKVREESSVFQAQKQLHEYSGRNALHVLIQDESKK